MYYVQFAIAVQYHTQLWLLFIPDYLLTEWLLQIQQAWYSQVFLKKRARKFKILTSKLYIQGCHWHFKLLGIYNIFEGREFFLFPMKVHVARDNIHSRQWKSLSLSPLSGCVWIHMCTFIISIQGYVPKSRPLANLTGWKKSLPPAQIALENRLELEF